MKMLYNDFHAGTKFLGAQTSQGPNAKFLGDKKSGAQMRVGTISVTAVDLTPLTLNIFSLVQFKDGPLKRHPCLT